MVSDSYRAVFSVAVPSGAMESFWSMLRRGYYGTYHRMSYKHLQREVNETSPLATQPGGWRSTSPALERLEAEAPRGT